MWPCANGTNQASKASAAQCRWAILGALLGSNSTGAALAQLGAGFTLNSLLLKYSRTDESQADIMGTQILYDSGYDPRGMGQFLEKIQALDQGNHRVASSATTQARTPRGARRRGSWTSSADRRADPRPIPENSTISGATSCPCPRNLPKAGQLQGSDNRAQRGTARLQILTASYGTQNKFVDVRQLLQSRVQTIGWTSR